MWLTYVYALLVCWDGIDPFMSNANFCLWGCIVRGVYEWALFNKNLRFESFRLTTGCCPPASSVTLKMHQSSKSTFCKFPGGTVEERQRNYLNFAIIWKVLSSFCLWQCLFYYITSPRVAYNKWYTGNKAIFALTNNPLCFSISNMTWLPIRDGFFTELSSSRLLNV